MTVQVRLVNMEENAMIMCFTTIVRVQLVGQDGTAKLT